MSFSFIMAVDPGITTGLCYGIVDHVSGATVSDLIAVSGEGLTVEQIWEKNEVKSGLEIAQLFLSKREEMFKFKTRPRCQNVVLVIEDFIIRAHIGSTAREGLAPVRVTSAIEAAIMLSGIDLNPKRSERKQITYIRKYMPAFAMGYATNDRMKEWGVFKIARGKPHARDAMRHWCTHLATMHGELSRPAVKRRDTIR